MWAARATRPPRPHTPAHRHLQLLGPRGPRGPEAREPPQLPRLLRFLPWKPFWPHHASQGRWPPGSPLALVPGASHLAQHLQAAAVRHLKTGLVSPRTLPVQLCTASLSSLRGFLRGLVLTQKQALAPHGSGTQHSRLGGARTWAPALPDQCARGCPGHQMLPAD